MAPDDVEGCVSMTVGEWRDSRMHLETRKCHADAFIAFLIWWLELQYG